MDTDDLLLRVRRRGGSGPDADGIVAELWTEGGRRFEPEPVLLGDYRDPLSSDPRDIAVQGLDLFNRLFAGRLGVAFQQAWAAAAARGNPIRLRLALDAAAPWLHAIPWELMHFDESGGLSPPRPLAVDPRIVFSRYIELSTYDEAAPVAHRPVRLLTVIAAPEGLERWRLAPIDKAAETRDLRTRFGPIVSSGQFEQDILAAATPTALERAIAQGGLPRTDGNDAAEVSQPRGYDVLLFIGHALHHAEAGSRLVLEDERTGGVRLYDGAALLALLKDLPETHRPSMVVLVACNSAAVAGGSSLNSLAARLVIDANIPAVLAMQRLVEISLARAFTFHLSEQLLRDGMIDSAVAAARRRVFQMDSVSWSTPVLYLRHRDGRLFTPNAKLDYVEQVMRDPEIVRWRGAEFIDVGVLTIAPGQDWNLLRVRPEDAPAATDVLDALDRALGLGPERSRGRAPRPAASNVVALIGPPHSGQTTVLRRLCHDLAERVTSDLSQPPGLLISLRGYEQQRGGNRLESQIIDMARAVSPALGDELTAIFRQRARPAALADRATFVFLLDDLDALPVSYRMAAIDELARLAAALPDQRFVIAATQELYPGQQLPNAQVLVIQPLNERRIVRYLRSRAERDARQIYQQIRDNRLLALASDPSLLAMIYERLAPDPLARVTRNQLAQEYLDRRLSGAAARYALGDAAQASLAALAWHSRWNHLEQIGLGDMFRVLGQVRRDRDYSLEELYGLFRDARLLTGVGQHAVRFVNPAIHAYLAALALASFPDADTRARLEEIIIQCSSPDRLSWWEDVLYFYAGAAPRPGELLEMLAAAIRAGGSVHALIAARCLEAVPPERDRLIDEALRSELLDACVLRLSAEREPAAERREQIATALGRLSYLQLRHTLRHPLRRLLVEPVRVTSSGPRYEYTNVRIAAARALRNIYGAPATPRAAPAQPGTDDLVLARYRDEAGGASTPGVPQYRPSIAEIRDEQMLSRITRLWQSGSQGRAEFLDLLQNSPSPPERALAAFALGDVGDSERNRMLDAKHLLRVIVSPGGAGGPVSPDWEDTMWAAADALTLFEPDQVIPLLEIVFRRELDQLDDPEGDEAAGSAPRQPPVFKAPDAAAPPAEAARRPKREISDSAAQQLAYVAGRVRATSKPVVDWLIDQLIVNPNQLVKAKALQSLAWMGSGLPDEPLPLPDGRPGPSLRRLVERIAAWRPIGALERGTFTFSARKSDADGVPLYLRRKAIEALAWIGDAETLAELGKQFQDWPLELREHWYQSAATIRSRIGAAQR